MRNRFFLILAAMMFAVVSLQAQNTNKAAETKAAQTKTAVSKEMKQGMDKKKEDCKACKDSKKECKEGKKECCNSSECKDPAKAKEMKSAEKVKK